MALLLSSLSILLAAAQPVVGQISPPPQFGGPNEYAANVTQGGLIALISNLVKLIIVVGGLWSFINLILAGLTFITSGDKPDEISKANSRMYMSLIGLVIMVGSFVLAGIFGWILFGNASAILNPKIYGPK